MPTATIPLIVTSPPISGTPRGYFVHGNRLVIDAVNAGYLLVDYYSKPEKITDESMDISVSDEDAEIRILYVLQRVLGKLLDWNGVTEIQRQYKEAIRQVTPIRQSQELETLWEQGGGYD